MGSTICTAGFPSAAIASSCFTARCDSIWYGFFIATLLFLGKRNCSQPIKGFERGSRYFLRSTGHSPDQIVRHLCKDSSTVRASVQTLLKTTLIRDEFIASLSLDLPEQTRFTLVRDAIGHLIGPDYSARTAAIVTAANAAKGKQEGRVKELQSELGRLLGQLTEARSAAERSADISEALRFIESQSISLPGDLNQRSAALRKIGECPELR